MLSVWSAFREENDKMYDIILFDLDGTLTDSGEGVKKAFMYALEGYGIHESFDSLDKVMGPPLKTSFMEFYGFSEADAIAATEVYREYYSEKGVFENKLYDGIKDTLACLKEKGKILLVATSKPDYFAHKVLDMFDISKYFDGIFAASMDGSLSKKSDILKMALDVFGANGENSVMVGDRYHDVMGAKENGINCIGAAYGYGGEDELRSYGACSIAYRPSDLIKLI